MKGIRRTFLWTTTALLLIASMALPWTTFAYATTEKADYSPGEVVTISGGNDENGSPGYVSGETVHVDVAGPNGYTAGFDATVDASGAWSGQVTLWANEQAVGEYTYTAIGQNVTETGMFTDGNVPISGWVKDLSNNPISGATVTCTSGCNTTPPPSTTTNSSGNYPPSGSFRPSFDGSACTTLGLTASMSGYASQIKNLYVCHGGGPYTLNFNLGPANTTPSVTANDDTFLEGTSKAHTATWSDPDAGQGHTCTINFGDGTTVAGTISPALPSTSGTCSAVHTYADGPNSYTITVNVSDGTATGSDTATATVNNVAPTATFAATSPIDEGSSSTVSFTNPSDPSTADTTAGFHYALSCTNGDLTGATYANSGASASTSCTFYDNGTFTVKGRIIDKDDGYTEYTASVTVNNVAPVVTITSPAEDYSVFFITSGVALSYGWTDPGTLDTFVCAVDWDDETLPTSGSCTSPQTTGSHLYAGAGVYDITVTVTDDDGGVGTAMVTVVVVDPSAGFVTGGGWINSPAGAYKADETLSGRANFGFVSKYQKGATVPTGQTEFQFKAGGLNFHSASYQWLVVNQAGTNAQYKGTGTINGMGSYNFMLWATDGSTDTFRIKIWEGEDTVIYDNGIDQAIDGGSIVIHAGKK